MRATIRVAHKSQFHRRGVGGESELQESEIGCQTLLCFQALDQSGRDIAVIDAAERPPARNGVDFDHEALAVSFV